MDFEVIHRAWLERSKRDASDQVGASLFWLWLTVCPTSKSRSRRIFCTLRSIKTGINSYRSYAKNNAKPQGMASAAYEYHCHGSFTPQIWHCWSRAGTTKSDESLCAAIDCRTDLSVSIESIHQPLACSNMDIFLLVLFHSRWLAFGQFFLLIATTTRPCLS